jgi:predicted ATPase/Tfp pilus assembly protein PilF
MGLGGREGSPETRSRTLDGGPAIPQALRAPRLVGTMSEVARARENNVPAFNSSFIGRGDDVARLSELLGAEARVVTVLGPGGIGKTRLAARVAQVKGPRFASGVWFVTLADARSAPAFLAAVASVLGVRATGGDSTDAIGHALAGRGDALLVLDNVEQVVDAAAESISRWSRLSPRTRFLVTSRERLRIDGEAALEIAPLAASDARALFVERARLVRGRFDPTQDDHQAIDQLASRLDGNPLAIELAAARTKLFSPRELAAGIGKRFELLSGGPRDRTPRQASLRGAIDWSWDLLSEAERRVLARASVFSGGFTLAAAEAVTGADLATVESLVDKSLIRRTGDGRFSAYESVREYASERLDQQGDREDTLGKHASYYLGQAEQWAGALRGPSAASAVVHLRLEADNVLEAHRRHRGRAPETAVRLALALDALLNLRGPIDMQRELLDAAVDDGPTAGDAALTKALLARARARLVRGDPSGAEADVAAALEAASRSKDDAARARALESRARLEVERGRSEEARATIEEAISLHVAARDRAGEATATTLSASIHFKQGHLDTARETYERALALLGDTGDQVGAMSVFGNLAIIDHWQGRDERAQRHYREALDLAVTLGDRREEGVVRINLALLLGDEGKDDEARTEFEKALAIQREGGHRQFVGNTIGSLGSLDLVLGRPAEARSKFEEALVLFRQLGNPRYEAATYRYLGTVDLDEGKIDEALLHLEKAQSLAQASGDLLGFVLGPLGATLALLGRIEDAERVFAEARASLEKRGEPRAFVLLEIFEAFLDVARGDTVRAKEALDRARERRLASDARVAARLLASAIERATQKEPLLEIGEEARWFQVGGGARVDLSRRKALRLVLARLAEAQRTAPGRGVPLDEIVAAGWPGERITAEAAASRGYTAIKTLREMGLEDVLLRRDDGYLLAP